MPDRLAQLTPWLHAVLGSADLRLERASDDASFRRYFRVHTDDCTYIVMDAPPERVDCRPFVELAKLLAAGGVNVPRVHASDLTAGWLLLDDFGSCSYLDAFAQRDADALYAAAIDTLITMQARVDAARLAPYDTAWLQQEIQLFSDWFLGRHLGLDLSATERAELESVASFLCTACLSQPQVFAHRDYHSRNLMLLATHSPGVLDFQDAVRGPLAYDLVSLLRDVYIAWPKARVDRWIDMYRRAASERGLLSAADARELPRWFDLAGVQRHLKVAGIFSRLYHRDGKSRYLPDIPQTLAYLRDASLGYAELAPVVALIDRHDLHGRVREANARAHETLGRVATGTSR